MAGRPQHVMRFYGNFQYALECIAFKQITFLHIDKLNDPFDSNTSFETDFNDDYQALINHVQQYHAKDLQNFKQRLSKDKLEEFIEEMENIFSNYRNSMFIFSTSEINEGKHPKDSLYMWSHYGNGHRGVAIEFDTTLLATAVLEQTKKLGGSEVEINKIWWEIKYPNEILKITCENIFQFVINDTPTINEEAWMRTELANILRERNTSKSMGWKIEKEWRLMWHNDETRLKIQRLDLIDDTITAVYLGYRYPLNTDHMNDDLIFETKRHFPKAEIFKARKSKGKSALDFERIATPS